MYPIECGFCQHGNPPSSRFCNGCGAPLTAEPCPHCGAVNDIMATICQKCDAPLADRQPDEFFLPLPPDGTPLNGVAPTSEPPLADRQPDEFFLPLPPEVPANAGSAQQFTETTDADPARRPITHDDGLSATATSALPSTKTTTDPDSAGPATPDEDGVPPPAPAESAEPVTFREPVASTPRRRVVTPVSALVIAGLAVAGYFAYHHFQRFQPSDAVPRSASTGEVRDRAVPVAPGKPIVAPAATPSTTAAVPTTDRGDSAVSQTKGAGGDQSAATGEQKTDLFSAGPARPQAPIDTTRPSPDQRPALPQAQVQQAPKAAAARAEGEGRRTTTNVGAGVTRRPPGSGPCTDALAALGLCTPENTQGRKP
jgi:hypothetical protein